MSTRNQEQDVTYAESRVPEYLEPCGMDEEPDMVQSRMGTAEAMEATVYPGTKFKGEQVGGGGLFRVVSNGEEKIVALGIVDQDAEKHIHPDGRFFPTPQSSCECEDFRYRCGGAGVDCKHILFVKRLISEGYLPPMHADADVWMEEKLKSYLEVVKNEQESTFSSVIGEKYGSVVDEIEDELETPLETDLREIEKSMRDVGIAISE